MPKTNNADAAGGTGDRAAAAARRAGDGGNIRSPRRWPLRHCAEWTVEDMAQAEPYPLPEVSEEDLRAFAEGVGGPGAPEPADEGAGQADAGGLPAGGTAQATNR